MNEALHDSAYNLAKEKYNAALFATSALLEKAFPAVHQDATFHAAQRGMQLYLAAYRMGEKVWAKELSYEFAESSLRKQFPDFSEGTCRKALSEAFVETR